VATKRTTSKGRRGWGSVRKLPSGRWQARYTGPDLNVYRAPRTFETKLDTEGYLASVRKSIDLGTWTAPRTSATSPAPTTLGAYAERWVAQREPLKPRTRELYARQVRNHLAPTLGHLTLGSITPDTVRSWYYAMDATRPTVRAHCYALLRTILGTAVDDGVIPSNPCRIRGGGQTSRAHEVRLLTVPELGELVTHMPEHLRAGVLLMAWCGLRYGELAELRRSDVEPDGSVVRVRRGVVYIDGEHIVSAPKSAAGVRDIAVPPHLAVGLIAHLADHVKPGRGALLFPGDDGGHLTHWRFRHALYRAARAIGRDDLHVHDLRHLGAVLAAQSGATVKELMSRLGHTSPAMSLRYQHVAENRDKQLAARLSALAGASEPGSPLG